MERNDQLLFRGLNSISFWCSSLPSLWVYKSFTPSRHRWVLPCAYRSYTQISSFQLIRDVGITNGDESQVGYYVGLMVRYTVQALQYRLLTKLKQSLFSLTQAFTILHWSRMSDRIGRKPVILIGLLGSALSMYCFGLSKTFWGLILRYFFSSALQFFVGVYTADTFFPAEVWVEHWVRLLGFSSVHEKKTDGSNGSLSLNRWERRYYQKVNIMNCN